MRNLLLGFILILFPNLSYAQTNQPEITTGLDAMIAAQNQNRAEAETAAETAAKQQEQQAAAAQAHQAAIEARVQASENAANAAAAAQQTQQSNFQETERQLLIEQQQIELEKQKADADREGDIITHQLSQQDAQTAILQSQANANSINAKAQATATVDEAQGAQALMTDTGEAQVKKASGVLGSGLFGK